MTVVTPRWSNELLHRLGVDLGIANYTHLSTRLIDSIDLFEDEVFDSGGIPGILHCRAMNVHGPGQNPSSKLYCQFQDVFPIQHRILTWSCR